MVSITCRCLCSVACCSTSRQGRTRCTLSAAAFRKVEEPGVLSAFGIASGCIVHTFAAAFGLSAILAASASAFLAVKMIGAAYLVYLGARMFLSGPSRWQRRCREQRPMARGPSFAPACSTNVLNPKVALFFLAFLPQFVDPATEHKVVAFLSLGWIFIFNGTLWCLFLAWSAAAVSQRLRGSSRVGVVLKRATGALFVGLGIKLALSE